MQNGWIISQWNHTIRNATLKWRFLNSCHVIHIRYIFYISRLLLNFTVATFFWWLQTAHVIQMRAFVSGGKISNRIELLWMKQQQQQRKLMNMSRWNAKCGFVRQSDGVACRKQKMTPRHRESTIKQLERKMEDRYLPLGIFCSAMANVFGINA